MRELLKLVLQNALNSKNPRPHFKLCMINLSHIRALRDARCYKCASKPYPLVESCVPEDLNALGKGDLVRQVMDPKNRLDDLMKFILSEVEEEQSILLAMSGFGVRTAQK